MGISKQRLYKYENDIVKNIPTAIIEKLLNHTEWTLKEMVEACDFLDIGFHVGEKGD